MCLCELLDVEPSELNKTQLYDHHVELMLEISHAAREVANLQRKIQFFTDRVEEVEFEIEEREEQGPTN